MYTASIAHLFPARNRTMGRFRFSITSFLVVTTLLAFGLSAYVAQTEWMGNLTYTLFLSLLCLAAAGAMFVRGSQQRFWIGFAVFGWCYWFVGFDASVTSNRAYQQFGMWGYSTMPQPSGPRLITSDILDYTETHLVARRNVGDKVMAVWRGGGFYPGTIRLISGNQYLIAWDDGSAPQMTPPSSIQPLKLHSRVAGHSVLGGLAALIGGMVVAAWFEPKKEEASKPTSA
jgi:hypothetical protein